MFDGGTMFHMVGVLYEVLIENSLHISSPHLCLMYLCELGVSRDSTPVPGGGSFPIEPAALRPRARSQRRPT
jgi:hypothetical protein